MQEVRQINAHFLEVRLCQGESEPLFWSLSLSICSAEVNRLESSASRSLSDLQSYCPGLGDFPIQTSALFSASTPSHLMLLSPS